MFRKTLLAALAFVAFGVSSAITTRADEVVTTVPSWDGSSYIFPFGYSDTATYGQTITPSSGNSRLNSFTFYVDPYSSPITFRGYVMAWDGFKATGPVLFESASITTSSSGMTPYTINTGGLDLIASTEYVMFFSVSKDYFSGNGNGTMGAMSNNPLANSRFVYYNNGGNFSALTTNTWDGYNSFSNYDLAFTANFSPADPAAVPEPTTMLLLGTGIAGVAAKVRRRRKKAGNTEEV